MRETRRTPQGQPEPAPSHQPPPPLPPSSPYGVPPGGHPAAYPPPGQQPYAPQPYGQQYPAYGQGYGQPGFPMPGYAPAMRDPDARPGTVLAAGIVTLVMSGLIGLMLLVFVFFLVIARESFIDGFTESADLGSGTDLYAPLLIGLLVFLGWCVAAMVLGVLVLRRKNWARICLVVSSVLTAVVSLVAIAGGVSVLPLACAIAVVVCLFTGGASDWFHHGHAYSQPQVPQV